MDVVICAFRKGGGFILPGRAWSAYIGLNDRFVTTLHEARKFTGYDAAREHAAALGKQYEEISFSAAQVN